MTKSDMEKIEVALKTLIEPKEKECNHLDSHKQINSFFGLIADELKTIHLFLEQFKEHIDNAQKNTDNTMNTLLDVKK